MYVLDGASASIHASLDVCNPFEFRAFTRVCLRVMFLGGFDIVLLRGWNCMLELREGGMERAFGICVFSASGMGDLRWCRRDILEALG